MKQYSFTADVTLSANDAEDALNRVKSIVFEPGASFVDFTGELTLAEIVLHVQNGGKGKMKDA